MKSFIKNSFLWILLFGSLAGLNETLIGSMNMPYRSVVLSTITLSILIFARSYFPKTGTSILIMIIAIVFKANTIGFNSCSSAFFLCGPTALLLLGIGFEIFSYLFKEHKISNYSKLIFICIFTSFFAFSFFAIMNTYILHSWDTNRLIQYIFIKGTITAIISSIVSIFGFYVIKSSKNRKLIKFNPLVINGLIGFIIIVLWLFGSISS